MFSLMVPSSRSECADDCCHPDHGHTNMAVVTLALMPLGAGDVLGCFDWGAAERELSPFLRMEPDTHDEWRSLNESQDGKGG